jgi:hypothetical protein
LRTVGEEHAEGSTASILGELRQALGLPHQHLYYPALAAYPAFLRLHWELLRPVVATGDFFQCAERLRADSYTRTHNYFRVPALLPAESSQSISAAVDFLHYQDPLLLLLFCAQLLAFEGATGRVKETCPAPPAPAREPLQLATPENASPAVRGVYEEIRRTFAYPYICPEFEAMGRWPEFLRAYWLMFRQQVVLSPLYDECRYGVRASAWSLASELPGPFELTLDQLAEAGVRQEEIASVSRILNLFANSLSGSLLNVATAKIALEGGNSPAKPARERGEAPRRDVA